MYVLGHRGIPRLLKENTLPSLLKAIELGGDGIETDIRLTKDGVPVIIHDDNLLNFCGANIRVRDVTFEELKNYKDGGYTVPSLRELLDSLPTGKSINLEIKEYEAGEITVEFSKDYQGEVIYSSFDHKLITELKYKYPTCKFGYLFGKEHLNLSIDQVIELFKSRTYSAHLPVIGLKEHKQLLKDIVLTLHNLGIKIIFWTVNDKQEIKEIQSYVDYVITDDVRIFIDNNR